MNAQFQLRRRALISEFTAAKVDGLLISHPANWYYLTGFTGEAGVLLVSKRGASLITDGRFTVQAREETSRVRIVRQKASLLESAAEQMRAHGLKRVGFDPTQISVAQLKSLKKFAGPRCAWLPVAGVVERLRMRKDAGELAQMRKAAILVGEVFEAAVPMLRPHVREFEVAAEIEYQMRKRGAAGPSFETIVAFGGRSALPHARPTAKRLRKNELVVLDLGVILGHYCSDMTRTVFVGKAPGRIRGWYQAVLEAQRAAVAAVRSGVSCGEVDDAARRVLAGYKLEQLFVHSTGHGLGLEVHEEPRVARGQNKLLEPGNVITIEPGVYAEGVGGIRIEDDVAVHADRTEVMTRVPRDLIEL